MFRYQQSNAAVNRKGYFSSIKSFRQIGWKTKAKDNVQKKGTSFSGLHRGSSSEQYHLSMNVAPDKTIILNQHII